MPMRCRASHGGLASSWPSLNLTLDQRSGRSLGQTGAIVHLFPRDSFAALHGVSPCTADISARSSGRAR